MIKTKNETTLIYTLNGNPASEEEIDLFLGKDEILWSDWRRFAMSGESCAVLRRTPRFERTKNDTVVGVLCGTVEVHAEKLRQTRSGPLVKVSFDEMQTGVVS